MNIMERQRLIKSKVWEEWTEEDNDNDWVDVMELADDSLNFNKMTWNHGLFTGFSGSIKEDEVFDRATWIKDSCGQDKHVCTSHAQQFLGQFGIGLRGKVIVASNIDLWSESTPEDHKRINPTWLRYKLGRVNHPDDFDFSIDSHTEIIIRPKKVVYLWINVGEITFTQSFINKVKALAIKWQVPLYEVADNKIIREVV